MLLEKKYIDNDQYLAVGESISINLCKSTENRLIGVVIDDKYKRYLTSNGLQKANKGEYIKIYITNISRDSIKIKKNTLLFEIYDMGLF